MVGAELMFKAMGYRYDGNGILFLDGPVCPDKVAAISKDCLIAYVECQVSNFWSTKISLSIKCIQGKQECEKKINKLIKKRIVFYWGKK